MGVTDIPERLRTKDEFHHIDPGFINQRLCLGALYPAIREELMGRLRPEDNNLVRMANRHLLVTTLLDCCEAVGAPTLLDALRASKPRHLFRSTERLAACPEVYASERVSHEVELDVDIGKRLTIAYHTKHLVSETGKMVLAAGSGEGHVNSIVGLLHDRGAKYVIEPMVIGAPWFDHPRNGKDSHRLMWYGQDFGEILPEDIEQFSKMKEVEIEQPEDWLTVMRRLPEEHIKRSITRLLGEESKKDWGGEPDDHYSGNVSIGGRRRTAAFMFKGPSAGFREMTLEMCGKRADQIHRMVGSQADVSIVQHCHQIGSAVRQTLRGLTVYPGCSHRKYCLMDGPATYRILKAYSLMEVD